MTNKLIIALFLLIPFFSNAQFGDLLSKVLMQHVTNLTRPISIMPFL
ncbi:MAG: hypothetical protein HY015_00265 [Bacteroidetes bacterium]|nr:hypothetical protein [Bacteroidota bacterium]